MGLYLNRNDVTLPLCSKLLTLASGNRHGYLAIERKRYRLEFINTEKISEKWEGQHGVGGGEEGEEDRNLRRERKKYTQLEERRQARNSGALTKFLFSPSSL